MSSSEAVWRDSPEATQDLTVSEESVISDANLLLLLAYYSVSSDAATDGASSSRSAATTSRIAQPPLPCLRPNGTAHFDPRRDASTSERGKHATTPPGRA
jgi:hypothetical protein